MDNFFLQIYHYFQQRKLLSLGVLLALITGLAFSASRLVLEEDITQLIPTTEENKLTHKVLRQVNFADKIILYLALDKTGEPEDLTQYAEQWIDSVQLHCANYVKDIQGKVEDGAIVETLDFVYQNLPLFLEEADYQDIATRLHEDSIDQRIQSNYKTLLTPSGIVARKTILQDPLGLSFLGLKKLQQLNIGDDFTLYNNFLVSKDRQKLLLFITPQLPANETAENALFVEKLYEIGEQLNTIFDAKVKGEYYGTTVIAVANAKQIKRDIQLTISIAMSILLLILVFFYKKISIPLVLLTPTLLGGLLGVSVLYWVENTASAISLGIGAVLLGITLDYSLHILTHYRNNQNIEQLYKDVTQPVLISSLTTACAFLCLLFLPSAALRNLGLFAAVSVIGASIAALVFIPIVSSYLKLGNGNMKKFNTPIDRLAAYDFDKSKGLILVFVLLLIGSCFTYHKVRFNQDLSAMNFQTEALLATEKKLDDLINHASKSVYVVTYGDSVEEALRYNDSQIFQKLEQLQAEETILTFSSIGSVVLSQQEQQRKIEAWKDFWTTEQQAQTQTRLLQSSEPLGFKPSAFQAFYDLLDKDFEPLSLEDYSNISGLLAGEYVSEEKDFATVSSLVKVNSEQMPALLSAFEGTPQTVLIDRQRINETFLGNLKNDFNELLTYSFIVIFLLLLAFFRRIELTLITISPILLTWWITIGTMGFLGLEFNIFNIIISTFIFGLGVDYSIFMTNGLMKNYKYGINELPTYRAAIILSVITTILGVGALIFAQHPALRSIAVVSLIGILSAVLLSFTLQPLLFRWAISGKARKGLAPTRFRSSVHGFFLFACYGLGGMILSVFSVTILPLLPFSKKKKMKWLHGFMSKMVTLVLYGNPFVTKTILNPHQENFDPPAVIISNHASALDTLVMGMVTPKLIYLVNDWVYKSPVFGLLARVTGFYPVSSGVEDSLDHLKEKLEQGYSLMVFPEGRRAKSNKIGRFHKGAFFLAEKLQLDILPFYLHGNSEVLPKGDRVIYDGSLTVKIGERIAPDDLSFGKTYKERQKKITAFYKANFRALRDEIEQADYFKGILLSNYIYKGNAFYQHVKKDFSQHKNRYQFLSEQIPFKSKIIHLADDYGQLDVLLVARSQDRRITTFIADEEKRKIAANCYTAKTRKVQYVAHIEALKNTDASVLLIRAASVISDDLLEGIEQIVLVEGAGSDRQTVDKLNHFAISSQMVLGNQMVTVYVFK